MYEFMVCHLCETLRMQLERVEKGHWRPERKRARVEETEGRRGVRNRSRDTYCIGDSLL